MDAIDIDDILHKLEMARVVVLKPDKSFEFIFSIKRHGHLLTPTELRKWLHILHSSSSNCNEECTDEHRVKFEPLND